MNEFEKAIKQYLDEYAKQDSVFATKYNPEKIKDCCNYIIGQVEKSGRNGFADGEIYHLAREFYDEGMPETEKESAKVVVNHTIELSDSEKEEAKQKALEQYQAEQLKKLSEAEKKKEAKVSKAIEAQKAKDIEEGQVSIFDLLGE